MLPCLLYLPADNRCTCPTICTLAGVLLYCCAWSKRLGSSFKAQSTRRHNKEMEALMRAPLRLQGPASKESFESWAGTAHQAARVVRLLGQLLLREEGGVHPSGQCVLQLVHKMTADGYHGRQLSHPSIAAALVMWTAGVHLLAN
jgi:hypothetical protein